MADSEEAAGPVADSTSDLHDQAQAAADGLKDQIAAVRARVRHARETLHAHARRHEQRSLKRKD